MRHETKKAFDSATALTSSIRLEYDVAQIATRGHVNAARLSQVGRWGFVPGLLFAGLGLWALYETRPNYFHENTTPAWIVEALTYDPTTYFDLGGGLRGGADMRWLADYKPQPESLSAVQFDALVKAVATDMQASPDPSQWATVAGLEVRPQITRPEKVFADHSAKLRNGIVALPEGHDGIAFIIAHVAGQWAAVEVRGRECVNVLGQAATECGELTTDRIFGSPDDYTRDVLLSFKPKE